MLKVAMGLITAVVLFPTIVGCAPTRHRPTVGPGGQINTRIFCRTRTPHKCTNRAEDVCGSYTVVEPLHLNPEAEVESTMVVHCHPPPPVSPAASVMSGAAAAPATAPAITSPAADGGA